MSIALNETAAVGVVACLILLYLSFSHPGALTFSLIDAVSIDKVWLTCTRTFSPGPPFLPSTARRCFSLCFLMNIGTIRIWPSQARSWKSEVCAQHRSGSAQTQQLVFNYPLFRSEIFNCKKSSASCPTHLLFWVMHPLVCCLVYDPESCWSNECLAGISSCLCWDAA